MNIVFHRTYQLVFTNIVYISKLCEKAIQFYRLKRMTTPIWSKGMQAHTLEAMQEYH